MFEFQIDEHQDEIAANVKLHLSTSPVGACVPVPDASIVDAEAGIAGVDPPQRSPGRLVPLGAGAAPGNPGGQR